MVLKNALVELDAVFDLADLFELAMNPMVALQTTIVSPAVHSKAMRLRAIVTAINPGSA